MLLGLLALEAALPIVVDVVDVFAVDVVLFVVVVDGEEGARNKSVLRKREASIVYLAVINVRVLSTLITNIPERSQSASLSQSVLSLNVFFSDFFHFEYLYGTR